MNNTNNQNLLLDYKIPLYEYKRKHQRIYFAFSVFSLLACIASSAILVLQIFSEQQSLANVVIAGFFTSVFFVATLFFTFNPNTIRAIQTDEMLTMARKTLAYVQSGVDRTAAQNVCELLLPKTRAVAVAITNRTDVLGYAGISEIENPAGKPIRTQATHEALDRGETIKITNPKEIGFPFEPKYIRAAYIVPLKRGRQVSGVLKFYFKSPRHLREVQESIAEGFGDLLSTQLASVALEEQTRLATSMELKALQAQINPHFLFNTINTIASFVRTDPSRARTLLREFATFYRYVLENTGDLIPLSREIEQTMRYFQFEVARFGEDALALSVCYESEIDEPYIPAFLIQPLVENAVRHARKPENKLNILIRVRSDAEFLTLSVEDDGLGMSEDAKQSILHPESSAGLGIAVKNVHDRVESYFGEGSHMEVESEVGAGTTVRLVMNMDSENLTALVEAARGIKDATLEDINESLDDKMQNMGNEDAINTTSTADINEALAAANAANPAEVSAASIREVDDLATQSESSGVADKFRAALSKIEDEEEGGVDISVEGDDDDWDYEAEMSDVESLSNEEIEDKMKDMLN